MPAQQVRRKVNGAAEPEWPFPPSDHPWYDRMQLELVHVGEGVTRIEAAQERVLDRLDRPPPPSGVAKVLTQALGKEGANVKWVAMTTLALALLAVAVWGVSATVTWGDLSISTGDTTAAGAP